MSDVVKLSDGSEVAFRTKVKHDDDNAYYEEVYRGVSGGKDIPAINLRHAFDALILKLIDPADKTQEWLNGLAREDYGLLYEKVDDIFRGTKKLKEAGKKNS